MTFDEWNRQHVKPMRDALAKGLGPLPVNDLVPAIDTTIIAPLTTREEVDQFLKNGSTVWTPGGQALETFRQRRLCKPPYKSPGWRPKA